MLPSLLPLGYNRGMDDCLIPNTLLVDAAIGLAGLVLSASLILLVVRWRNRFDDLRSAERPDESLEVVELVMELEADKPGDHRKNPP